MSGNFPAMFLAVAFTLLLSISFLYFSPDGIILVSTASNQVEVELKDEGDEDATDGMALVHSFRHERRCRAK